MKRWVMICSIMLSFATCAKPPVTQPELALEPFSWWRAGLEADDLQFAGLADAARRSLDYYQKLPSQTAFVVGPERITAVDMAVTLQNFLLIIENASLTAEQKVSQIKNTFDLYRSSGSNGWGRVLFTGYYEPVISCRRTEDGTFKYPLYRRPNDIIEIDLKQFGSNFGTDRLFGRLEGKRVVPYYSREEIEQENALSGRGLEVLWCADPVDIYILQVQGSGRADLGNGTIVGVLYDGQNGRPYKSIGRYLIDIGAIEREKISMPAIREYLGTHPDDVRSILSQNPSYVFFRVEDKSAVGNINVPLTPGRSIATDSRLFPKGGLALIRTERPIVAEDGTVTEWVPFTRFVLNQDTGGAIRGPGRVDLFWGRGHEAEFSAGNMKQEGKLYFLVRKKQQP
jgi:membrane-bound lytic murein transglycosylase A